MANTVFPKVQHDWLKHELDAQLFRRAGVVKAGAGVVGTGLVLGRITASGKYAPLAPAAADGTEVAAAIVIDLVDATAADAETSVLVGNAQIVGNQLTWPAGTTTPQKTAALVQLAALGIVDHQRL